MRRRLAHVRWLPLVAALFCASCSGGLHTVSGKVLYKGQPAKGAVVVFHPKGGDSLTAVPPTGLTDEEGMFTLATGTKPGAAAGEYAVTITWPEEPPTPKDGPKITMEPAAPGLDRLKGRYADAAKPAFSATIKPGKNQLEPFDLR